MRRFSAFLVLFAWLLSCGVQWDLLQGVAWTRMVVSYSRTMPLKEAVRLAFQPDNVCGVCRFVSNARQEDPGVKAPVEAGNKSPKKETLAKDKLPLATFTFPVWDFSIPMCSGWPTDHVRVHSLGRAKPPTEPPRMV